MNIEKSQWSHDGQNIHLSVPFTKVNREKRTVSGFATLDNVDQTGDVVTAEASLKAFESFRGNLREMHQPLAVGKLVSFNPETYYDAKTKEFYNGVYVTSYISKGAQDTWEKVLDGTLSGFSIGGKIKDSENEMNKSTGETVRFIKEYDLVELSIVDSPANEMCNIVSIEKVNGQFVFKGIATNVVTENIFYCEDSDSVFMSTDKTYSSPVTGKDAVLIGWVESSDQNKAKEIDKILASFKKSRLPLPAIQTIAKQANVEGGNKMSDVTNDVVVDALEAETIIEKSVDVVEAPDAEVAVVEETTEDTSADNEEKAADTVEVKVDEPDFAKMLGDLKGFFSDTLSKATEDNQAQVADIKNTINGVQKRVDAVEGSTAIKKSSDLGGSVGSTIKKSKWNGSFLGSVSELIK